MTVWFAGATAAEAAADVTVWADALRGEGLDGAWVLKLAGPELAARDAARATADGVSVRLEYSEALLEDASPPPDAVFGFNPGFTCDAFRSGVSVATRSRRRRSDVARPRNIYAAAAAAPRPARGISTRRPR